MIIPNGPYHYFLPNRLDMPPRICEISGGYAYFTDDSAPVRVAKLGGTFILLTETGLPLSATAASEGQRGRDEGSPPGG